MLHFCIRRVKGNNICFEGKTDMATEYEALQRARELADQTNETWFVVTSREQEGADYDVATSGSLSRQTVVCGMARPTIEHDETSVTSDAEPGV